jgi:hypothetical protein
MSPRTRNDDFYAIVDAAGIIFAKDVPREKAVRIYSALHGAEWALQIRAPQELANGRDGAAFGFATARLSRADMVALRDAIDGFLQDDEES